MKVIKDWMGNEVKEGMTIFLIKIKNSNFDSERFWLKGKPRVVKNGDIGLHFVERFKAFGEIISSRVRLDSAFIDWDCTVIGIKGISDEEPIKVI